ncbi:DUF3558 domain-containing protein [Saccharopolyspora erythraea]|nr:DUF3558 domain-containing protein [Saccharopolyspora erythraea]
MMVRVEVFNRSAVLGAGVVLIGLLGACSGGGSSAPQTSEMPPAPQVAPGPAVADPKDAAAAAGCGLLSDAAAAAIGLKTPGEVEVNDVQPGGPEGCTWELQGPFGSNVNLTPFTDRSLKEYYDNRSTFSDFQELTIAGHPAVRANQGNPASDGYCGVFLATKQGQVLSSISSVSRDSGVEPCGLAQKALEASVPSLPAAK